MLLPRQRWKLARGANDVEHAEAIAEAVQRPTMKFVAGMLASRASTWPRDHF